MDADLSESLQHEVKAAFAGHQRLRIAGSGSKRGYGQAVEAKALEVSAHRGVINYEPTELVITARAGTPLAEIEALLRAQSQMLAFEPPRLNGGGTLGGAIASGLSGPRRPYAGSARDFVLGCRMINGRADILQFGGEVMKNVAGFDVSRLMAGALGTLGLLLEVSLKVLPRPEQELTLAFELDQADAIRQMNALAARPLPLSAAAHLDGRLLLRLSGAPSALRAAQASLGGEALAQADQFWNGLRDHTHEFFAGRGPLWRLSVPAATAPLDLPGSGLIDWGGAQRWLIGDAPADAVRGAASRAGGHATLWHGADSATPAFQPLPPAVAALHQRIKTAFDPSGIFNPGQLYGGL